MSTFATLRKGDRVRLVALLTNDDTSLVPTEDIPVGTEGVVTLANQECHQVCMKWDNGSTLALLPGDDGKWELANALPKGVAISEAEMVALVKMTDRTRVLGTTWGSGAATLTTDESNRWAFQALEEMRSK